MNSISYIYSNLDRNNRFLLIMIGVIILLLILIFIVNHFSKKKTKTLSIIKSNDEFNNLDLRPSVKIVKGNKVINNLKTEPTVTQEKEIKKEMVKPIIIEKTIKEEPEKIEQLEEIEDEVIEIIEDEKINDIDRILLEMEKAEKQPEIDLTEFEREQEENAIISYDELCKKAGVKKIIYKTKKEEEKEKKIVKKKVDDKPAVAYSRKYEPSKVISPIYGYQNNSKKENNITDVNDDIEFLGNLKKFRNGLE